MTMRLFWAGLIFGAGYVLGRPEGRAKLAELSKRPEVTQLRQRTMSTVSSGAKTSQQQLTKTAHKVRDTASEKLPRKTGDGSGAVNDPAGSRRGLRLPSFPRRGLRPEASAVPAAGPVETTAGTATDDTSTSPVLVNGTPAAPSAASPGTPDEQAGPPAHR
jgi:hypothetical protein